MWRPTAGVLKGMNKGISWNYLINIWHLQKTFFALYGRWENLAACKILLRGVGISCPPGKQHSENFIFVRLLLLCRFVWICMSLYSFVWMCMDLNADLCVLYRFYIDLYWFVSIYIDLYVLWYSEFVLFVFLILWDPWAQDPGPRSDGRMVGRSDGRTVGR